MAPAVQEAACLGAAAFAAAAAGWHADIRVALATMVKPGTEHQPALTAL